MQSDTTIACGINFDSFHYITHESSCVLDSQSIVLPEKDSITLRFVSSTQRH